MVPSDAQFIDIFKGRLPFLSKVFLALLTLYSFPEITRWLPKGVYGE